MTTVRAALLHPLLTVAAGDDANGLALAHRARRREIDVDLVTVQGSAPIPAADIYLLGGTGLAGVAALARQLGASDIFAERVQAGAVVLAVDAGLDALGRGVVDDQGQIIAPALGLLGFTTGRGHLVSESVVTRPVPELGLPALGGWVQHQSSLHAHPGLQPFAELEVGRSDRGRCDGVISGHVVGTRLHGPALGRNPEAADLLLAWATGRDPSDWPPLPAGPQEYARDLRADEDRAQHRAGFHSVGKVGRGLRGSRPRGESPPRA
jgi:CobQ-like glutamine amidotransferase family enzyme